jgi:hypothetical protein
MPTVRGEIEFELYCGICGSDICPDTSLHGRTDNVFTVTCSTCEKQIDSLKDDVDSLKSEIEELKSMEQD